MLFKLASLIALAASFASAQTTDAAAASAALASAVSSLPQCALTCTIQTISSGTGGCSSATDIQCVCTSTEFQNAVLQCYESSCTTEELQQAEAYGQQICSAVGVTLSIASTPSGSMSGSMTMSSSNTMSMSTSMPAGAMSTAAQSDGNSGAAALKMGAAGLVAVAGAAWSLL